ncbi:MAG: 50S ribosomal protein L3 N(5)-glutamine methyltransferase [Comamonadaceae bacterium]|jgi:ribosomal protein L3 glutamine methyltransferase
MTVFELIAAGAHTLEDAGVSFGHGTTNAFDESAWLVLWQLGLPLDSPLQGEDSVADQVPTPEQHEQVSALLRSRIESRKPAAYLTHEAWLQGLSFYVDDRVIVPRSLIAELLVSGAIDPWLGADTHKVLDLCTGNASLAVFAALAYPAVTVDASDLSVEALAVARINLDRYQLRERISLLVSDGLASVRGPYDLILCNPPYVNAQSMAALPPEYRAEPSLALDGNRLGASDGMDFVRQLLIDAPEQMTDQAILVIEIGNEREHFEAAFGNLEAIWLQTSAGEDQVLLLTRDVLLKYVAPK